MELDEELHVGARAAKGISNLLVALFLFALFFNEVERCKGFWCEWHRIRFLWRGQPTGESAFPS